MAGDRGVVYKAEDTRLGRPVALEGLHRGLTERVTINPSQVAQVRVALKRLMP